MMKIPSSIKSDLIMNLNSWICEKEVRWFNDSKCKTVFAKRILIKAKKDLENALKFIEENKLSVQE